MRLREKTAAVKRGPRIPLWSRLAFGAGSIVLVVALLPAQQGGVLEPGSIVNYVTPDGLADPITLLQKDINAGKVKLDYEPQRGYLVSVLDALNVPVSSQTL